MPEVKVRNARASDVDAVAGLLMQLGGAMERPAGAGKDEIISNLHALLTDSSARVLVAETAGPEAETAGPEAESAGRLAGMLDFCVRRTAVHPAPSALIDEIVVDERMRGRGVGRALIEAAVSEARRMGCCEIEVSTERFNEAARRFYAECGFDEESVLLEKEL
jgi:GNAT superfamily N-acetyltransferase